MLYAVLKAVHLFGVVLLVGNVIVTLAWKLGADRTGQPSVIAFGQRLVTLTDWWFTLGGVVLILIGGFGMAWVAGLDPFGVHWLVWGQILFGISGLLWALILIPTQIRQARQASRFEATGEIPAEYWRGARRWTGWGILAIVPLLAAIWIMTAKPTAVPAEPAGRLNRDKQEQIPHAWTVSTKAQLGLNSTRGATV
ncbi:putative integral membrane protein [Thiorhodovibrio winogradskyi]|uniref:Integral membrane protein n=1 Tax=Thiorhodovibrio winogradskyi TaxID=77007 RepID=A0ABZ0SD83_9GAMM|nr:DUF2269 domain-containing protein [Thiorhodovibrio winogradskyi]